MTEYSDVFSRFILVKSTKIRFPASNNDICVGSSRNLYHWIPDILTNIKHMHNMVWKRIYFDLESRKVSW